MTGELATTNVLLGIMAVVSVLEALLVVGIGIAGIIVYRRVMDLVSGLETQHVAPAMAKVNAILDDVHDVTTRVKEESERVDQAIRTTLDRVDDTADRVRTNVRAKTGRIVGLIRGVRVVLESMLQAAHQPHESHT